MTARETFTAEYGAEPIDRVSANVKWKYKFAYYSSGWDAATIQHEAELEALRAQINAMKSYVKLAKSQNLRKTCNQLLDLAVRLTPEHSQIAYTNSVIQQCANECVKIGLDKVPCFTGDNYKIRILRLQKEIPNDTKYSES